ncbi:MAG: ComF family protein [Lentisphaerae bacterium]|jgi:ComF family protein|nr:ComF family protein [Lentisphaerota bacterium]
MPAIISALRRALQLLDCCLAPPICPFCRLNQAGPGGLCPDCLETMPQLPEKRCRLCGGAAETILSVCRDCVQSGGRPWNLGVTALPYRDSVRAAVQRYKYGGQTYLARFFAAQMAVAWHRSSWPVKPQIIVPIPLHWTRLLQRHYNQSELLAQGLAALLRLPCSNALQRVRRTPRQAGSSKEARKENLRQAFALARPALVQGRSVLLVDDVFTTGSTLGEASRQLLAAGAAEVSVITIARD